MRVHRTELFLVFVEARIRRSNFVARITMESEIHDENRDYFFHRSSPQLMSLASLGTGDRLEKIPISLERSNAAASLFLAISLYTFSTKKARSSAQFIVLIKFDEHHQ